METFLTMILAVHPTNLKQTAVLVQIRGGEIEHYEELRNYWKNRLIPKRKQNEKSNTD